MENQDMSNKKVLHIENLDCPVCAEALQADLQKIKGVDSVAVDYVTQTITLQTNDEKALQRVIDTANRFEEVRVLDGEAYLSKKKHSHVKEWVMIVISAIFFLVGILLEHSGWGQTVRIIGYCAYVAAYLSVGYPILLSTAKNITKGRIFDENFLMTVASIGAVVLGEYSESVLVMLLYQLGELLQGIAVGSSRASVAQLMELKSEWATVLEGEEQRRVAPEEVQIGDLILIKAGEKVPVDGILMETNALFDTKSITGEAAPKTCRQGEEILSGYINIGNVVTMKATRKYTDSAVGRVLDMVENAAEGKAAPEKFITKFARYYTPIVCLVALLVAIFMPFMHGWIALGAFDFYQPARWVKVALTFLVISCPCALIISVPLTYFSGIGACAKNGILVKGATYLDIAAKAQIIAFDKTGTLTEGSFSVCAIHAETVTQEELLSIVAAVERASSHPIAKAFDNVECIMAATDISEVAGKGLRATLAGEHVLVGNEALLSEYGIKVEKIDSVHTVVYVARGNEFLGSIEVGDGVRQGAKECIVELKKLGIPQTVMLTGDNRTRANSIARDLQLDKAYATLLPDEKLKLAQEMRQKGGLIYVGDGINDAPVMVEADCAVSMGKLGSAAAIEASDFVLISDDITALPKGIRIARKTRSVVMQNIIFSIAMKLGFMALGVFGVLPLALAVFADVGVMLLAVCNSFRVRFIKMNRK